MINSLCVGGPKHGELLSLDTPHIRFELIHRMGNFGCGFERCTYVCKKVIRSDGHTVLVAVAYDVREDRLESTMVDAFMKLTSYDCYPQPQLRPYRYSEAVEQRAIDEIEGRVNSAYIPPNSGGGPCP